VKVASAPPVKFPRIDSCFIARGYKTAHSYGHCSYLSHMKNKFKEQKKMIGAERRDE